jgi:hypothetical protein
MKIRNIGTMEFWNNGKRKPGILEDWSIVRMEEQMRRS